MLLKLNKYLFELRNKANILERTDINGVVNNSLYIRYGYKFIFLFLSLFILYYSDSGFSETFISYISTVLSIFVGLFITALIFSFDKFYKPININISNSEQKIWEKQSYNYAKQFAFIIGYNIILSIFTILLVLLSTIFNNQFAIHLLDYEFIFSKISFVNILLFFKIIAVLFQRVLVYYWLLKIMYNTLFLVSSMVKFMTIKINRDNDKN